VSAQRPWKQSALFLLVLLLDGLSAPAARAQIFHALPPWEELTGPLARTGRFTLAAYAAQWENPFRVTVTTVSPAMNFRKVSRTVRLIGETPASPLLEGAYALGRGWNVGFWYNPIRGERLRKNVPVAERLVPLDLQRDVDLADLHVIYDASRGLSAQLGYYRERGTIHDRSSAALPRRDYTLVSWNLWVTQRLDVSAHGRRIAPFVSAGYHPASGLGHAASVLTGVEVALGQRVSLSGSVWLFDLSNPATRVTGGVVVRL
jgi:hypothetical protein